MSGYCEIGSVSNETKPTTTVITAMTIATMGRRIKNFDIGYLPPDCAGCEAEADGLETSGVTGAPSRSFWTLSVMTRDPLLRPLSTIQLLPNCGPSVTL